jgi:hypothetical protein
VARSVQYQLRRAALRSDEHPGFRRGRLYFEADPPFPEGDKRRFGYSRDHRPDCVQIIIALVVTPEGLPLAYEVLPGNTADKTTLRGFLERIERQYGKARRVWLMDRGVPTEEVLAEMRAADPPVHYLVGTPKGRLTRLEKHLIAQPWQQARPGVQSLPRRRPGSSCWRKKASSTFWHKATTASPRSGQCGGAS